VTTARADIPGRRAFEAAQTRGYLRARPKAETRSYAAWDSDQMTDDWSVRPGRANSPYDLAS
jgi:hypothetical protein